MVELAGIGPVPFAGMLLADLGASIVRIDRAGSERPEAAHRILDRGRDVVTVNLKTPEGLDEALRLVDAADVLIEGYRPGVAERLGLGPDACLRRNPRLVYARMTGWGRDDRSAGHDINYLARSGVLDTIGRAGGPPVPPVNYLGDFAAGGYPLVTGVLAALYERERSGLGQVVDVAIVDGAAAFTGMLLGLAAAGQWRFERGVNVLDTGAPFYDVYRCADGRYVAVGAIEEPFYAALLAGLSLDPAQVPDRTDPTTWPVLREMFASRFATRNRDTWAEAFAGTDGCVTPVLTIEEAAARPGQRGYRIRDGLLEPAPGPLFSRTPLEE